MSEPREFLTRFFKMFNPAMGIANDAKVQEVEVELDAEDDDTVHDEAIIPPLERDQSHAPDLLSRIFPCSQISQAFGSVYRYLEFTHPCNSNDFLPHRRRSLTTH